MKTKIVFAAVAVLVAFGIGLSISQSMEIQEKYSKVFYFDATFYEDKKYVEITFSDESQKTTYSILEILGMKESFQKSFTGHSFKITVPFDQEPEYGWKVVPVTLIVNHSEFGSVGIKTDIHKEGVEGKVIFSQL